jgi:hypothetical protein
MPCNPVKVNTWEEHVMSIFHIKKQAKQETSMEVCLLPALCWLLGLGYSSNLKMEVTCFSETSADFQQTAQLYILEDRKLSISSCFAARIKHTVLY